MKTVDRGKPVGRLKNSEVLRPLCSDLNFKKHIMITYYKKKSKVKNQIFFCMLQ